MNTTKYTLKYLNTPDHNGIVYTKPVVEKALERLDDNYHLLGGIGMPENLNREVELSECSHAAINLRIEDNELVADILVLDTPQGKLLPEMLESGNFRFSIGGVGVVDGDTNEVSDLTIQRVSLVTKEYTKPMSINYNQQDRIEKIQKLTFEAAERLIFEWVKTGVVSLREFSELIRTNVKQKKLNE